MAWHTFICQTLAFAHFIQFSSIRAVQQAAMVTDEDWTENVKKLLKYKENFKRHR